MQVSYFNNLVDEIHSNFHLKSSGQSLTPVNKLQSS